MVKLAHHFLLAAVILPGLGDGGPLPPVDVEHAPWRGLLRVQTEMGGRCTGFLVAPLVAITAAHCLFLPRVDRFLQPGSVHVLLRYKLGRYAAHARVARFVISRHYDPHREQASAGSDRAILMLDHPLAPAADAQRLAATLPTPGTALMLAGYGQDRDEIAVGGGACRVLALRLDARANPVIVHDCAGTRGTSGAPLLARGVDGAWEAVGVQIEANVAGAGGLAAALER